MSKTAERIKERRLHLDLSQLALAYKIGKSLTQVIRYEKGENDPTGEVLIALAQTLETTTDYLLGLVDDPEVHFSEPELNPEQRAAVAAITQEDYELASQLLSLLKKEKNRSHGQKLPIPKTSKT